MKTKLVSALIALLLIILFASSFHKPQELNNKYVVMRTYEGGTLTRTGMIMIVYEDETIQEIELDKIGTTRNTIKINNAINTICKKGYELVSSNGGDFLNTYIFVRK